MTYLIDFTALAGAAAIVAGVYMIHIPAAFIVGGLLAVGIAVTAAMRGKE